MDKEAFNNCMARVHNGDISGIEPIYNEYYEKLVITAKQILKDRGSSEDAASDTILKIIEYAKSKDYVYINRPGAFRYVSARNTALDKQRKDKRIMQIDELPEVAAVTELDGIDRVTVNQFMETLDERRRRIGEMYYLYNSTCKEISEKEHRPEGTVKWIVSEIRKASKKFFDC